MTFTAIIIVTIDCHNHNTCAQTCMYYRTSSKAVNTAVKLMKNAALLAVPMMEASKSAWKG